MDKFRIVGGKPLRGKIQISGAKNSALPCLAAALLTAETVTLHNVPYVRDLITQRRLLEDLGATVLTPELNTHKLTAAKTTIQNAAREPEIEDLAVLLNKMGARVKGAGTDTIEIEGVEALGAAEHTIIPDRIETGTFLVAAAITDGELEITNCRPEHLHAVIEKMREANVEIEELNPSTLRVATGKTELRGANVVTAPHPNFPTDMQAQFLTLMTQARGDSRVVDTIFENGFMHVAERQRMGAQITVRGNTATVHGATKLHGAQILASDLRASASLVLAALAADGESLIDRVYHIDRGYESIVRKFKSVGANIERISE